ncbi:hypothetical protein IKO50_01895 [bacterium]|nr:hypothetical protein [bacterium]
MQLEEQERLRGAFNAVFDEKGQVKNCGRDACSRLIQLMKKYSSENVGDESKGILNVDVMKSEYCKVIVL